LRHLQVMSGQDAREALKKIDVDPYGMAAMLPKMTHLNILIPDLPCKVANIIKQDMLANGGDAAVARGSVACSIKKTDVVMIGTVKQIRRFADKMSQQPFGLSHLARALDTLLDNISVESPRFRTAARELLLGDRTWIMGIVNVTPDSFSDGGAYASPEKAIDHGMKLVDEGADILDIGGESSRPGAGSVSVEEELRRMIPVVRALAGKVAVPLSVDTTKAAVAREALASGAEIINDISALKFDALMPEVVASTGAAVILMHMRGTPGTMQRGALRYKSLPGDIIDFFNERLEQARSFHVSMYQIMIDPGLGFGKTREDNFRLLRDLPEFKVLGRPILVGPSRKSFTGRKDDQGPKDRLEGTSAAVTAAIMRGAHMVRVHDVKTMKRVVDIADAIIRGRP
jgi:dihydropteroate synthase